MNLWKIIGLLMVIPIGYIVGCILYAKFTYYTPQQVEVLFDNPNAEKITDTVFSSMIWNIGYAGLGEKSDFFYDKGKMVRPTEEDMNNYFDGIMNELNDSVSDFIMLQEVDSHSKRSYFLDEASFIRAQNHSLHPFSYFAFNYKVNYIPQPWLEPMGKVNSGLLTLSNLKPRRVERHQLPGAFGFLKQLFFLRRCLLITYIPLENGKDLVLINVHNSAYDDSGKLKIQEMDYLKNILEKEVQKENYIICGGDWNQCPPNFPYNKLNVGKEGDYFQTNVENLVNGGHWIFDATTATNRKNNIPYDSARTFTTIIDFYWLSNNLEMVECKTKNQDFKYSDHQPVYLKFKLK